MKSLVFLFVLVAVACDHDNVRPIAKKEAKVGQAFAVSQPTVVTFQEADLEVLFEGFSEYWYPTITYPTVYAGIRYKKDKHQIPFTLYCAPSPSGRHPITCASVCPIACTPQYFSLGTEDLCQSSTPGTNRVCTRGYS